VETVTSPKVEMFYWGTILFSQTLGTALGDWMADTNGLGYEGGALVFGAGLALVAAAYFFTNVSRTLLFWAAFILTRPLGATLGDLLDKPVDHGGFASAGLAKRRRKDFDRPKGQSDFGDLAQTDFVRLTRLGGPVFRPLLGWVLLGH